MIVTDKFIFLHLHKSGGTFVNNFILKFIPSAQEVGYHLPGIYIPEAVSHLPVFGLVRNPWSYYVSWFTFQSAMVSPNIVFRVVSNNNTLGFNETIQNLLNLSTDHERIQAIAEVLPLEFKSKGINITKNCMQSFENSGIGFYSFLYNRIFSGAQEVQVGNLETLRIDLKDFLQAVKVDLTEEAESHINLSPRLNITQHNTHMQMFDQKTADLVSKRDSLIIKKHDYRF